MKRLFFLLVLLICSALAQAQVFSLTVDKTNETCSGNGSLTMNVQNANAGATVTYSIYRLPATMPLAVSTVNFFNMLSSGNYRVVATQSNSNVSASQEVSIERQIVPLEYVINGINITCGNWGELDIAVTSGVGATYEIISGPVTRPAQVSTNFSGLPSGEYQIRVIDVCGQGWVMTHTLFAVASNIRIAAATFPEEALPTCNSILAENTLTPASNTALTYPLAVEYKVFPPGGGTTIINRIITGGDRLLNNMQTEIPFFHNQSYSYRITITDNCGQSFSKDNTVNKKIGIRISKSRGLCGNYSLKVNASIYKAPYNIRFVSAPIGFIPLALNPDPGPYSESLINFGDINNPVVLGNYEIEITDDCGRSERATILLAPSPPSASINIEPYTGCQSNKSKVTIHVTPDKIVSANIVMAPIAYTTATPVNIDVSSSINTAGHLILTYLPAGDYRISMTDNCGTPYTTDFAVPDLSTTITTDKLVSCEIGKGSLKIKAESSQLQTVVLTAAPLGYTTALPLDVSQFINSNHVIFSLNDLIPGDYHFKVTNSCDNIHETTITVAGYSITSGSCSVAEHCGSFDVSLANINNSTSPKYWLQKWNSHTNSWVHPETNTPYTDGTRPTATNSYSLRNNATNYNIGYNGNFRVIKSFDSYENGNIGLTRFCVETLHQFDFFGAIEITAFEKTSCEGMTSSVAIDALGSQPLRYEIELKNGSPFPVRNYTDPLFVNLEPGVYKFVVYDVCNNFSSRFVDVGMLPAILTTINTPQNLAGCENAQNNNKADFVLSDQNAAILGSLNPLAYNISYHISPGDATTDINPLPDRFTSENTTVYARVEYNNRSDCYGIVSFDLTVNERPTLQMPLDYFICPDGTLTLIADSGYLHYDWSNGDHDVTQITVRSPGMYTLTVSESANDHLCSFTYNINVQLSEIATVKNVEILDLSNQQNTIVVHINQPENHYTYSLDNIKFQQSNTFTGIVPGKYYIYIKDINGCQTTTEELVIYNYPRFFTPNNDGHNDHWGIVNGPSDPSLEVKIFDQYGQFLKTIKSGDPGWDGTINGRLLPASDYWFIISRENGKIFKSHFSLKR